MTLAVFAVWTLVGCTRGCSVALRGWPAVPSCNGKGPCITLILQLRGLRQGWRAQPSQASRSGNLRPSKLLWVAPEAQVGGPQDHIRGITSMPVFMWSCDGVAELSPQGSHDKRRQSDKNRDKAAQDFQPTWPTRGFHFSGTHVSCTLAYTTALAEYS